MGGGSLNLEILRGGGAQAVLEIQAEGEGGRGSKTMPIHQQNVPFASNYMI